MKIKDYSIFKLSVLALLLLPSVFLFSQNHEDKSWCNLDCEYTAKDKETADLIQLRMQNDSIRKNLTSASKLRFPLRFGIVQEEGNFPNIPEVKIRQTIDNLNKSFSNTGFVFYLERIDLIESPIKLEDLSRNRYDLYDKFSQENDLEDMLTILILDHKDEFCMINNSRISCARTGGFSYILSDRANNVVISQFDLNDSKVVAHEIGHFFGLFHTFEESLFGRDNFDQQSCYTTGDRLCDTPPDPGTVFEIYVNYTSCEMMGYKDVNGNEYKPLLENYMSYYKPCYLREYSFTHEQEMVMMLASQLDIRKKLSR